jgi:hypothetical protein
MINLKIFPNWKGDSLIYNLQDFRQPGGSYFVLLREGKVSGKFGKKGNVMISGNMKEGVQS